MTDKVSHATNKISLPSNLFDRLMSGRTLILLASLANTSLWVMTGVLSEGNTPIAWFSAICLGLSVSLGLVKIAEKWAAMPDEVERRVPLSKPAVKEMVDNDRKKIAAISFSAVLSVEALMLAPVIIALEGSLRISQVLHPALLWLWAIGRPLVAVLVMAGLAVVNDAQPVLVRTSTTVPAQHAPQSTQTAPAKNAPATVKCALCGVPYAAVGGKGGHYKKHHPKSAP